jgi:hypothetical protein
VNKGFVIMAQNTYSTDYVKCAEVLSDNIKRVMPDSNVTIITTDMLPYGDLAPNSDWKLINDWQVYEASPYEYTIKLEADMFIPRSIDYWWDILKDRDVVVSTSIRDYKGNISDSKFYRQFVYANKLPDTYNAITYFRKSDLAKSFYNTVRNIFENWEEFKTILKCNANEPATTDFVYAIACHVHGVENTTMPMFTDMSMVHMKQFVNELLTDDWTNELVYELLPDSFRVSTFTQKYPFHYHVKHFSSIIEDAYGRS